MLGSQSATISVVLESWCSEELHRTILVWLLRDQSVFYNRCYLTMESKVNQMYWFQRNKNSFYQFKNLVVSTCRNRSPGKWNRLPNLVNHKIAPTTHKIAPLGAISPTLKTTGLDARGCGSHLYYTPGVDNYYCSGATFRRPYLS